MKDRLYNEGKKIYGRLTEINDFIYHNPELGNEEYKAVEVLTAVLKEHNFKVEEKYLNMETAFKATFDSNKPGLTIGYLCEYDALPEIGHGCGHNMIGAISAGAGIVLSKIIDEVGGKVIVYGTPAEETNGGKVQMVEEGAFDELDCAMMVHPNDKTYASGTSSALYPIQFTFKGKISKGTVQAYVLGSNKIPELILDNDCPSGIVHAVKGQRYYLVIRFQNAAGEYTLSWK